ncbi:Com family DNA-binding transcriptional regulator [Polaromonas sp. JS666]|uniref:Com family DNA-binding transcriptional regulator n=1 Tax=Polaromonas sp. (strain JS666 / ATCC BAA-500) TaxID=296591 RepID=UPI0009D6763B|nr:Com family DNA-binding transcriptional regulator [Polaromonas sp. JS666]
MQEKLEEIRCGSCQRKLGAGCYTRLEIKCPRCGALNILRARAADHSSQSTTQARPRASSANGAEDDKTGAPSAH